MLEELYLPDDFEWEVEAQSTERINAMFSELDHLSHLTKLHICIKNAKILPKAMVFGRLESYRISISRAWKLQHFGNFGNFTNFISQYKLSIGLWV